MKRCVDLGGRRIIKKIFFKQKTAYAIDVSDWSSDVCSSDLLINLGASNAAIQYELLNAIAHYISFRMIPLI